MSREIDEKIVEMRFDNEHFEKNVQTSMSTLDKFKEKLKFKNAGKSFTDVERAAKNTDLSPLAKSADKVGLRFNAMYTVADQAFRNITNSAMAAGKRIVSAFTIDPVKTGLSEYETKMNAVQVIQSNTRAKYTKEAIESGKQMEDITQALDELNTYADKTIYNFAQMTSNVGKFVAQGLTINEATQAVQGLANLAAASGASAEDMARATYQMSQALGGTIRLMDWNSLRNANMATVDLKDTLIALAKVNGIAIDDMIAKHGAFEQTLQEGWLSGKMFSEAMNIYSGVYSEAELKAKGFTDSQVENFLELAKNAESAATEVKTFTQLFDVLKETAQSGWTQTWELLFGDFNTAKTMFTELQVYFSDFINAMSDARNMLLEGALNLKNPWSKIQEKLEASSLGKIVKTFDKVKDSVKDASETIEHFQKIVNDVWRGDYKTSDTGRYEMLEAAGYNHKIVQDLVNKGYGYKLTMEDIEESHKKFGVTIDGNTAAMEEAEEITGSLTIKYNELTDAQLEQAGLTKEEIKLFRQLSDEAERQGVTMLYLVDEMSKNDGRTLLIDSFKNAWQGLVGVLLAVRDAWVDIFPPMTVVQLYSIIKAINKFSESLTMNSDTQEKLTRTLRGVFAILDVILTLVSLPLKIAFKLITQLLSVLDVDILSVTASIGDVLVAFRDWIDRALDFTKVFEKIVPPIKSAIKAFAGWIDSLKDSKNLPKDIANGIVSWFGKAFNSVIGWFKNLKSGLQNGFKGAGDNVVVGLLQGLWNGIKVAGQVIVELGKALIDRFCDVLGIHSPSVVFIALGGFIVSGLLMGIKAFFPEVWSVISEYALKCVSVVKDIDFGSVFSALMTSASSIALLRISKALANFSDAFGDFGTMLVHIGKGARKAMTGLGKALGGLGANLRGQAIKEIAIAIAILAGAIVVLSLIPPERLAAAVGVIVILGVIVGVLSKFSGTVDVKDLKGTALKMGEFIGIMLGVSAAVLLLAIALHSLSKVDWANKWESILLGIIAIVGILSILLYEFKVAANTARPKDIARLGAIMSSMAGVLLMLAIVLKIMDGVTWGGVLKGVVAISLFGSLVVALSLLTKNSQNMKMAQIGSLIKNVGTALLLMSVAFKIIGGMEWGEIGKGLVGVLIFSGIVVGLLAATRLATDKDVIKAGKLISSVGGAMLMMAFTAKIIATMSWGDMIKAAIGIAAFGGIVVGLIAATKLATDKELKKVGSTILMMSIAIGVMGLVASMLSFMSIGGLIKGVTAVGILGLVVAAMVKATANAKDCMKNLIVMSVAIALMASAVATLSLIKTEKLIPAVASMALMMGMFAVMIASTKFMATDKSALISLGAMVLVVAALGAIVWGLSELVDAPKKALVSVISLTVLMGALTVMCKALNGMTVDFGGYLKSIGALILMTVPLLGFMTLVCLMPSGEIEGKEKAIIAVTGVMAAMTGIAILLSKSKLDKNFDSAFLGMMALELMTVPLFGFMTLVCLMPSGMIEGKEKAIIAVTGVMAAMTGLVFVLSKMKIKGEDIPGLLIGIGALTVMVGPLAAFVGALNGLKMDNIAGKEKTILAVAGVMAVMSIVLSILSTLEVMDIPGLIIGIVALTIMVGPLAAFVAVLNKLKMDNIAGKEKALIIVAGIVAAMAALAVVVGLATPLVLLAIVGMGLLDVFALELVGLASCLKDFAKSMSSFTDKDIKSVKRGAEALKAIADAAAAIPNSGGVAGFFAGNNDLDDFVEMLTDSMEGIKTFVEYASTVKVGVDDLARVKLIGGIISAIAKAASEIPNTGGKAGDLAGNNDLDAFIKMVLGDSENGTYGVQDLVDILGNVTIPDGLDDKVEAVTSIITNISKAAKKIPQSGGVWSWFTGNSDLNDFIQIVKGTDKKPGVTALVNCFSKLTVEENLTDKVEAVKDIIIDTVTAMNKISKAEIPKAKNVAKSIDSLKTMLYGTDKVDGDGMVNLINLIGRTIIPSNVESKVESMTSLIKSLTGSVGGLGKESSKNIKTLGENLIDFAKDMSKFADKMSELDGRPLHTYMTKVQELIDMVVDVDTNNSDSIASFAKAMNDIASNGIKSFAEPFSSDSSISDVKKAINTLISSVAEGVKTDTNKSKFTAIGKYLVQGLASGITNNASLATTAMQGVVDAVEATAKSENGFDINSPSKKFIGVGKSVDEGLAEGITENEDLVDNAMTDLTDNLLENTEDELEINSPSLVYNEVGRLIIEGLAEGIEGTDSAEIAFKKKLANIYTAWVDWNKNNPNDQKTFAQAFQTSGIRVTSTMESDAKEEGFSNVFDYLKNIARNALAGMFDGKEKSVDEALKDVEYEYSESIEEFEKNIKGSQSKLRVENSKLNFFKSDEERIQSEIEALEYQNEQRTGLIGTLEDAKKSYSTKTNIQMDDNIIKWNNEIADIQEEMAEADARLEELREQQLGGTGEAAAQEIGAPLLKYSEQLGHHIVENIAYGIKEDMSAEEQAKQKAQNINDAFQQAFDAVNTEKEKYELEYQNWELNNSDATQSQKDTQLLKSLNNQLSVLKTAEEYAKSEYLETKRILGENAKETKAAYNDWLKAQNEVASKRKEITDTRKEHYERDKQEQEDYAKRMEDATDERRKSDYDIWVAENQNASEELKHTKKLEYLNAELVDAEDDFAKSKREFLKLLKQNNDVYTPEVIEARTKAREDRLRVAELTNDIVEEDKAFLEYLEEVQDELIDTEYNLWLEQNRNASEEVKRAKNLEYLNQKLVEATEDTIESEKEYRKLLEEYNDEEAPAVKAALVKYNKNAKEQAELENSITDAKEEAVAAAEERKDIAYRIAKLKYDIWEKTAGRDAEDEEKEAKQLEYLSEQYSIQTQRLQIAAEEYNKAVADYGINTTEANRAYEKMLNESYSLAELQNQILDLQESAEDRKKRLRDKQDLAYKDYEDYIKRYEKYYLANGMSREDLERDAQLVSGYDPTNVVGTITKKTKTAVEDVENSQSYQNILSSFTDMGASYVGAINTGISEQSVNVSATVNTMMDTCLSSITARYNDWKKAGGHLVDGLANGIRATTKEAVLAAKDLAYQVQKAMESTLQIKSPSRVFAEIGTFAVKGLVKGLVDNTPLAETAATNIGDKAIENLQNTIKQISEVVNSDMDAQPTIRPVLDLSNVRSGTARLNAMVSQSHAIAISASRKNREQGEEIQNGNDTSTKRGNTYQFTQNNYSPKALSRTEIYRQTKNQFTALKEVLTHD